jgi:hypothetical protein
LDTLQEYIYELIQNPSESLNVELKGWFDPFTDEGKAKLARACIGLRNNDGGFLLIGFDDLRLEPDLSNIPDSFEESFHKDVVQGVVTKYSSEPFEVEVYFGTREGVEFPVIRVPPGVRVPVAAKSDLKNEKGKYLIKANSVYVRSLNSNNTPSTTEAKWKDWERIVELCFENREADIGRFLRRHLGGVGKEELRSVFEEIVKSQEGRDSGEEVQTFLDRGFARFEEEALERKVDYSYLGSWEVSFFIDGVLKEYGTNNDFLNLLHSTNPDLTGWPIWLDSRGFRDQEDQPYVYEEGWEEFIVSLDNSLPFSHLDFYRMEPSGRFYSWRALEDDISKSQRRPESGTCLDFVLPILRVAEAMEVGLAFGQSLLDEGETGNLWFVNRWKGLKGRKLCSWVEPGRMIRPSRVAKQDEVQTLVSIPSDTPRSAITPYLYQAVSPVFEVFGGFSMGEQGYQEFVDNLINRRL